MIAAIYTRCIKKSSRLLVATQVSVRASSDKKSSSEQLNSIGSGLEKCYEEARVLWVELINNEY